MLVGGLAFSNLQRYYGVPAMFLGILIDSQDMRKLRGMRTKDYFQPDGTHLAEPFDLATVEEEISKYASLVKKRAAIEIPSENGRPKLLTPGEATAACQHILDKLQRSDLEIIAAGVREVRLHDLLTGAAHREEPPRGLGNFVKLDAEHLILEKKGSFSEVVELARLIVWHRYLCMRREKPLFVRHYFEHHGSTDLSHLTQVLWPRAGIDVYADSFVGYPEVVVKNGAALGSTPLSLGCAVSLFPIAKCCTGAIGGFNNSLPQCVRAKGNLPFGVPIPIESAEPRCSACRADIDKLRFGLKGATKRGQERTSPVGAFSGDPHLVYLSLFGSRLKVGRARLVRGIARLLEQGAADALVLYPLASYEQADGLERELLHELKLRTDRLSALGINAATGRATLQDKIDLVQQYWEGLLTDRTSLYDRIRQILGSSLRLGTKLRVLQHRILHLTSNWQLPEMPVPLGGLVRLGYWGRIAGHIRAVVGSVLVVDNGVVDLEKLQGCVFRGVGFGSDLG